MRFMAMRLVSGRNVCAMLHDDLRASPPLCPNAIAKTHHPLSPMHAKPDSFCARLFRFWEAYNGNVSP